MSDYQERDAWQAIHDANDPLQRNLLRVQLAKLLLEGSNQIQYPFSTVNPDILIELIQEYKFIATALNNFLNKALPHLDPELKGQAFEQQLIDLQTQIITIVNEINRIREQNIELIQHEKRLQQETNELQKLEKTVSETEEHINVLQQQIHKLEPHKLGLTNLKDQSLQVQQQTLYALNEVMQQTDIILKKAHKSHKTHFNENVRLSVGMQQVGMLSSEQAAEIVRLRQQIGEELQKFDGLLKRLIPHTK